MAEAERKRFAISQYGRKLCFLRRRNSIFTFSLQFTLEGHAAEVYDIRLRKATNELLTTSEDKTAKIFKLDL